jgi:4-hydroxybenzoyl-CoA reductase alpha subunit
MNEYQVIGKSSPRIDGKAKATGRATYLADLQLPRMLYGKVLRSPIPHGQILHIDTTKAEKIRGVKAIITGKQVPKIPFGFSHYRPNKLSLEDKKVRYIGDEVAALAAVDEDIAEEAIGMIKVDYKELPALFGPEEAMEPGAVKIHEDVEQNIAGRVYREFGNIDEGLRISDLVFEDTYETQGVAHCCMETRGALAYFDGSGKLTLFSTTQFPHVLQDLLSKALNFPHGKIRVIKTFIGGAFGSRMSMDPIDVIAPLLAQKALSPVKITNSRQEEFSASRFRYPMKVYLKTGVKKDGILIARYGRVITDNGAYSNQGVTVTESACGKFIALYPAPHIKVEALIAYTNKSWGAAFRGYGGPQVHFAIESQIDTIAEGLGMDPMELRLKNVIQSGDRTIHGWKIGSCGLEECIRKSAEASGWKAKRGKGKNRGIGMASMIHTGGGSKQAHGTNFSSAIIKAQNDGSVDVFTGAADLGQGSDTMVAQIVAEILGLSPFDVNVVSADTDLTPPSLGARGSRQTFMEGNAIRLAALDVKKQILEQASKVLNERVEDLELKDKEVYLKKRKDKSIPISAVVDIFGGGVPIVGKSHYIDTLSTGVDSKGYGNFGPTYTFGAHVLEVEVDPETGYVKILNVVAAHDVGKLINPMSAEGQIEGGVSQGIGFGLTEKIEWDEGKVTNPSFLGYKIPNVLDMPTIRTIFVETNDPYGPFGAKGLAEPGLIPTAPALANAIYDAVGVRVKSLPITPEKILKGIREKNDQERAKKKA